MSEGLGNGHLCRHDGDRYLHRVERRQRQKCIRDNYYFSKHEASNGITLKHKIKESTETQVHRPVPANLVKNKVIVPIFNALD